MLIALAGLPSAGKSSAAKQLACLLRCKAFVEPEEDSWPSLVQERNIVGEFTALSWFRSARVPLLFHAKAAAREDGVAVIDSYYDVLVSQYLGHQSFSWLLSKDDPYFSVARMMVDLDWNHLPKADVLVMLLLNENVWLKFMGRRARNFDHNADLERHFSMQAVMLAACEAAAHEHGSKLLVVEQFDNSPIDTARRINAELQEL